MRRQVKPFVTEYRGTARRQKDQPSASEQPLDTQATRPRPVPDAQRVFAPDKVDTSYEAALRAADALFAPSPRSMATPAAVVRVDAQASNPTPAEPAAPEVDAAFGGAAGERSTRESTNDGQDKGAQQGRILQAIEPPDSDRFAALEAERAPKRRGRKPGSKNKPKTNGADDWAANMRVAPPQSVAEPIAAATSAPAAFADAVDEDEVGYDAAVQTNVLPVTDLPISSARVRNERFGWKRSGLRPGERWKRRLPKAAW